MPTYQYKCKSCEHRFEVMQRITEDSLTECPECHGEIRRVLFPAGVVFKGSGWYVTDYRSSGEKAKYESEAKGESGAASDTKSESSGVKSEKKTESAPAKESASPSESSSTSSKPTETKAA